MKNILLQEEVIEGLLNKKYSKEELEQLSELKKDGCYIQNIKNPNKKFQLEAINSDPDSFKYIKNPDIEVVERYKILKTIEFAKLSSVAGFPLTLKIKENKTNKCGYSLFIHINISSIEDIEVDFSIFEKAIQLSNTAIQIDLNIEENLPKKIMDKIIYQIKRRKVFFGVGNQKN